MCMEKMMKTIADFGEFVRETWAIWVTVFGLLVVILVNLYAPPTVTLDAKHWECVMAIPDGLGTRCTEYIYKGK